MGCSSLTDVTLPAGLDVISAKAFKGCGSLTDVSLPAGLAEIGAEAFKDCGSLTDVSLPGGLDGIGEDAFRGCTGLTGFRTGPGRGQVRAVDGVLYAGETLLRYPPRRDAASFDVPAWVTAIAAAAFEDCALIRHITLPDSLCVIDCDVFDGCTALTRVTIPERVTVPSPAA